MVAYRVIGADSSVLVRLLSKRVGIIFSLGRRTCTSKDIYQKDIDVMWAAPLLHGRQPIHSNIVQHVKKTSNKIRGQVYGPGFDKVRLTIPEDPQAACSQDRCVARKCVQVRMCATRDTVLVAGPFRRRLLLRAGRPGGSPGQRIVGRLSMVLDMVIGDEDSFVAVSDCDEKIQVSCFPNCYNIRTFCLGHTQFVTSLALLPGPPQLLVSGSGDGTVRTWCPETGRQLHRFDITAGQQEGGREPAVKRIALEPFKTTLACLLDGHSTQKIRVVESMERTTRSLYLSAGRPAAQSSLAQLYKQWFPNERSYQEQKKRRMAEAAGPPKRVRAAAAPLS
ncbi:hypothetical protein HPB48_026028 [Haemaphysalis longicornis]|uniref:WD repeat-containing protein 4 homolog n=1 Tax=Haemaphysalis longicornis TaxID=44386 RepID=A0A9J6H8I0_HAELO|nr:hypothetical protein HPB48_026028 [Haemaphysalis longicornis]